MNKNDLQSLQQVKAPDELKEKTLAAAHAMRRETQADARHVKPSRRAFGMGRRIVAAVCAFALVLGGTALWRVRESGTPAGDAVAEVMANSFGVVAYAADTGEVMQPRNSKIVFTDGAGADDPAQGFFSGCLFRVTGENIRSISAAIDKGGLYRAKTVGIAQSDVHGMASGTDPRAEGASQVMVSGEGGEEIDRWHAELCYKLENGFVDAYDAEVSYGFWAPPAQAKDSEEDLQQQWHSRIDTFDGATLELTVTFADGTTRIRTMNLKTGKLGCEYLEGVSGPRLTGEVLTDEQAAEQGYIYGVYAEIE